MINFKFKINPKIELIALSFLLLFVELTLIRWTSANIFFLGFYTNFILLASFLGIGIGFLRSSHFRLFRFAPVLLAIVVLFCYQYRYQYQIRLDPSTNDLNYMGMAFKDNLFPIWFSLPIIFCMVTAQMAAIADGVARLFAQFTPLQAYRLDILGSIAGIVTFSLFSYLNASPFWWGIIISLLFLCSLLKDWRSHYFLTSLQILGLAIMLFTFAADTHLSHHIWSPYYKIGVESFSGGRYVVKVNGAPQQIIESVSMREQTKPFYFMPYAHAGKNHSLNNVLVVGAGTGGDVAIALSQGAKQVDSVEIDPTLYELGKQLNPDKPYDDTHVKIHINDGRAYMQRTAKKYDMVVFALPDSLMVLSQQSSLRLENYLFTLQGFQAVYEHLQPNGIFTMYNYYRDPWIIDRLATTLIQVFKHSPCFDTYGESGHWLSVLTISKNPSALKCSATWQPITKTQISPSTDDHPFLYLKENTITLSYALALLFIFLNTIFALRLSGASFASLFKYSDLFLMGAAFLLLETKNITHFALLFGSTWAVNALVFIGILMTIYFAVELINKLPKIKPNLLYVLLMLSLFIAWKVPASYLLSLSPLLRFSLATIVAFSPILIANLIFAERFRRTEHCLQAFGANLIGALFGGLLEYISLLIGYQALFVLIAILYMAAILMMRFSNSTLTLNPLN